MKTILVIGGAGFLGSHLCEELLARGHQVHCVDNFSTGRQRNIQHLMGNPRFAVLRHDCSLPLPLPAEEIYNLSCPACPVDRAECFRTCVLGTLNLLEWATAIGARLLQASHGEPDWTRSGPANALEEGEGAAQRLLDRYHRQRQVVIRLARVFTAYGPRMPEDDGWILPGLITRALDGQPITLPSHGSEPRSLCYVDDLVAGLIGLMEGPEAQTGPVDLGGPTATHLLDLAQQVVRLTCSASLIACLPPCPAPDPPARPDLATAHRLLGWQPKVPLETGLQRTIDYCRWLRTTPPWAFEGAAGTPS